MPSRAYVVASDGKTGLFRLYGESSPALPDALPMWRGDDLAEGYAEMARLNAASRRQPLYLVQSRTSGSGRQVYRVGTAPLAGWTTVSEHRGDWKGAVSAVKALTAARLAAETAERERMRAIMARVGIESKRIPRFTETDLRYVAWLRETGRIAA